MIRIFIFAMAVSASLWAAQRVSEAPAGALNGTNATFTLSSLPYSDTVRVFQNGLRLTVNVDYTLTAQSLAFSVPPSVGDSVTVEYQALIPAGYHMLLSKATGACMMPSSTGKILTASCAGTDSQKLTGSSVGSSFPLLLKSTGQVLDLTNASTADGTPVITAASSGSRTQGWLPVSLDNDNFFELTSYANTSSCLTVSSGAVILQTCSGLDTQKWQWQ